jgi:hypothetical protein
MHAREPVGDPQQLADEVAESARALVVEQRRKRRCVKH